MHFKQILIRIKRVICSGLGLIFIYPEVVCSGVHERHFVESNVFAFIGNNAQAFKEDLIV